MAEVTRHLPCPQALLRFVGEKETGAGAWYGVQWSHFTPRIPSILLLPCSAFYAKWCVSQTVKYICKTNIKMKICKIKIGIYTVWFRVHALNKNKIFVHNKEAEFICTWVIVFVVRVIGVSAFMEVLIGPLPESTELSIAQTFIWPFWNPSADLVR